MSWKGKTAIVLGATLFIAIVVFFLPVMIENLSDTAETIIMAVTVGVGGLCFVGLLFLGIPAFTATSSTPKSYTATPSRKRKRCECCGLELSASDTDCPDCGHDPEFY